MQSFYTISNFMLYCLGLFGAGFCVILLGDSTRRPALLGQTSLSCLLCCSITLPLSRTCPYPGVATFLLVMAAGSGLIAIMTIAFKLAAKWINNTKDDSPRPEEDICEEDLPIYRWIMDSLRERMIIISDQGVILDWGDIAFDDMGPFPGDTLDMLVERLGNSPCSADLAAIFDALRNKTLPEGKTIINGRHCHYWSCRIGTAGNGPVILALADLEDEYELLEKLGRQQGVLEQRLKRLEEDRDLELELAEDGLRRELDEMLDVKIDGILHSIEKDLQRLGRDPELETCQLDQLIKKVGDGMNRIRSHIHDMEYTKGLNPWP